MNEWMNEMRFRMDWVMKGTEYQRWIKKGRWSRVERGMTECNEVGKSQDEEENFKGFIRFRYILPTLKKYICIYIHTHTHTHIYIYIYINVKVAKKIQDFDNYHFWNYLITNNLLNWLNKEAIELRWNKARVLLDWLKQLLALGKPSWLFMICGPSVLIS